MLVNNAQYSGLSRRTYMRLMTSAITLLISAVLAGNAVAAMPVDSIFNENSTCSDYMELMDTNGNIKDSSVEVRLNDFVYGFLQYVGNVRLSKGMSVLPVYDKNTATGQSQLGNFEGIVMLDCEKHPDKILLQAMYDIYLEALTFKLD